jgi:peptide/nickel transport system ATP-binding protein
VRFDGEVLIAGRVPRALRRRMTMIFQDALASLNPRWPVHDSIAEPLRAFSLRIGRTAIAERVAELLDLVGLPADIGGRRPRELSFGQAQRVAIARALASEPAFLVCDEPTSALDVSVQAQVLNLLRDLQARLGLTMLFISHDTGVVRHMADLVGVLHRGRLVEFGAADAVFAAPGHPYTRQALAGEPALARASMSDDKDAGCAFRARCGFARDRCAREAPELHWAEGVAVACHAVAEGRA